MGVGKNNTDKFKRGFTKEWTEIRQILIDSGIDLEKIQLTAKVDEVRE